MRFRKILAVLGITLLAGGTVQSARADQLADIKAAGVLRVATSLSVEPFTYVNAQLQPDGSEIQTAKLIAHDLGVKLEFVSVTVASRIPTLLANKADIVMSVLVKTPERAKVIDFSLPYAVNRSAIMAPKGTTISSYADLNGKVVGVARGTVEDQLLTANAVGAIIHRYEDDPTVVTAAATGQIGAVADTLTMLKHLDDTTHGAYVEKFVMKDSDVGIGIRKGNPQLEDWLNNWIKANLKNGKLNAIYKQYHGDDLPLAVLAEGNQP